MARSTGTLANLLDPISPETFIADHWGQRTLFVPGKPGKLESLFGRRLGWEDYNEIARRQSQRSHKRLTLYAAALLCGPGSLEHRDRTGGFLPMVGIDPVQAPRLLAAGVPVPLAKAHWYNETIAEFVAGMAQDIVGLRELDCLLTTNVKGAGVTPHFDAFPTLHIQLSGSKHWYVGTEPEQPWPMMPGVIDSKGHKEYIDATGQRVGEKLDRTQLVRYDFEPGDMLYMPAGTWHEAHTEGAPVLGLELLFNRFPISEVVFQVLAHKLGTTGLRHDAPVFLAENEDVWSMPEAARREFETVINELRAQLDALESTDFDLHRAWKRNANGFSMEPDATLPVIRPTGTERPDAFGESPMKLTPDHVLAVSNRGPLTAARGGPNNDTLVLTQQSRECPVGGPPMAHFGLRLVESAGEPFRAGDSMGWSQGDDHSWDVVAPLLTRLLMMGFLERSGSQSVAADTR